MLHATPPTLTPLGLPAADVDKRCTRCSESYPADDEFFRPQPRDGHPHRLAPWCRACEADQKRERRALPATATPTIERSDELQAFLASVHERAQGERFAA
jgi:hypothetical protein